MISRRLLGPLLAAALLTACTPAGTTRDVTVGPATEAAIKYRGAVNQGSPEQCDLSWWAVHDSAVMTSCRQSPERSDAIMDSIHEVGADVPWPGGADLVHVQTSTRAVVLRERITDGTTPTFVLGLAKDPKTSRWLVVRDVVFSGDTSDLAQVLRVLD